MTADFVTVDAWTHTMRSTRARRRAITQALAQPVSGLRSATTNYAHTGTFSLVPRPTGTCLIMAWDSPEAAHAAWDGRLGAAMGPPADFRMDGEVARARVEYPDNTWHGWRPSDDGTAKMARDEPLVVVVHGVVHPRHLSTFLRDTVHAASRAAHHPGHRGSIGVSTKPPFENTSVSAWSTVAQAQDFAYGANGHSYAMKHARELGTHRTGVFLQVRPLASTGALGTTEPAFPELPPVSR